MAMAMAVALVAVAATDASRQQEFKSDDNIETSIRKKKAIGVLSTSLSHLYSSGSQAREGGHLQWAGHPLNLTKTITHRSVQTLISEVVLDHRMLTVKTSPHHRLIQPPLPERAFST